MLDDTVSGRRGDDVIRGEAGNDFLLGGDGKDSIDGGNGADLIAGGAGHDSMSGGNGRDVLVGGKGHDAVRAGDGIDLILMNLGDGKDQIFSSAGEESDLGVLSLGGGATAGNISLRRDRDDLLVEAGGDESEEQGYARAILKDWYLGDGEDQTMTTLQVIENGVASLYDLTGLSNRFNEENPDRMHTGRWFVAPVLSNFELSSGGEVLGGSLALNYAESGAVPGEEDLEEATSTLTRRPVPVSDESDPVSLPGYRQAYDGQPVPLESPPEQAGKRQAISKLLDVYLSNPARYDFDLLARELAHSNEREHVLSVRDIARRWNRVSRYSADVLVEDENVHGGAEGQWQLENGPFGYPHGGGFGHAASTGDLPGVGPLKMLQGLYEGFRRLHT
jgi:hypothetical protein